MALAAYPNDESHQSVDHFAVDIESDSDTCPKTAKNSWSSGYTTKGSSRPIQQSLGPGRSHSKVPSGIRIEMLDSKIGMNYMRDAAKAPMLGQDLTFPKSLSPRQSRFDATQYPCSQAEQGGLRQQSGLWLSCRALDLESTEGLWHGVCTSKVAPPELNGQTPRAQEKDAGKIQSDDSTEDLLSIEQVIDQEVPDDFVTQVYNYLSLGYPSLARRFDDELSKATELTMEEIRWYDDKSKCGFVDVPEGDGSLKTEVRSNRYGRWTALRLYMREWVRQQPQIRESQDMAWGDVMRRGSWAI